MNLVAFVLKIQRFVSRLRYHQGVIESNLSYFLRITVPDDDASEKRTDCD